MSDILDLDPDELVVLRAALDGPLGEHDPTRMRLCMRLCGRGLMQRAGSLAAANGWPGSPHAFVLTRDGWALLKARRRRPPLSRAG